MKRGLIGGAVVGLLLAFLALPGCGKKAKGPDIVCTTAMVADVVRNVAGGRFTVEALMGEGVDPHLYESTPGDAKKLENARLVFYSGLHLEGKLSDLLKDMASRKPTHAVAEGIPEDRLIKDEQGAKDPHVWFDVELWSQAADVVRDALIQYDPDHADEYRTNARAYKEKLAKLHEYARKEIGSIPRERRVLVTAHDAFSYFGRAYDIEVRSIQGISTEDQAGLKKINQLVDFITRNRIKAVFVETSVSDKNIMALVEGCEKRGHRVVIGGKLFSDAMGEEGTPQGTYEGMIRHNVDTIVKALK